MSGVVARSRTPVTEALLEIQAPVAQRLDQVVEAMRQILVADLPLIGSVTDHLLRMRGKMFRPTLTLLSSAVEGTPEDRAIPAAAVVELMHLATLVHDDSVDHSVLRRGLPTINALFSHQVSVIMGDFLYSRALTALVRVGDMELMRLLTNASNELTIGEMRQLALVDRLASTEEDYYATIRAKTAALLAAACEIGAVSGAPRHRKALAAYGDRLGMAFQIADDIMDYVEDSATTGKPSGLDLKERKVTLPLIGALPSMTPAQRATVDAFFAADEDPDDASVAQIVEIVIAAGGIEYARRRGEEFAQEAEAALASLPDSAARAALHEAVSYVMNRRA
ncbi:MAG TPA: polyprenyl synthetase family protein [Gemmatimonadaceae bacterium]|nr:polyprenyl synthetase family protein [Gemmatimonadaceae bacterium]